MHPNLPPGSCFVVRKFDQRASFPEPGQIVVLRHPVSGEAFIKRLIAIGGQTVAMEDGVLIIDGLPVQRDRQEDLIERYEVNSHSGGLPVCRNRPVLGEDCLADQFTETLPNGSSYTIREVGAVPLDNFGPVSVPDRYFFVLGDNRDNSIDSRMPTASRGLGLLPKENLEWVFEGFLN